MNLQKATALVTGGASGIGFAIAKALIDSGTHVAITGRNEQRLADAAKSIGALAIRADVTDESDVQRTYREVMQAFGHLDILVNNAGFGVFKKLVDMDRGSFDAILLRAAAENPPRKTRSSCRDLWGYRPRGPQGER